MPHKVTIVALGKYADIFDHFRVVFHTYNGLRREIQAINQNNENKAARLSLGLLRRRYNHWRMFVKHLGEKPAGDPSLHDGLHPRFYRNFGVNTYGIDFGNNSALQSGAAAGAPGHPAAPNGAAGNAAPGTNAPHGVPQGNDNQALVPNGPAIKAARQSLASGEDHKAVLAFNTASGHLSQLQDAITALNNGDIKMLNTIANKYGVATGQSAPVVFEAIRNAVSGELGKVFKGQVTDSEIEHIGDTLGKDLGPDALSGVVKADANLMMSKLSAVHDSFFGLTGEHPYVLYPEGAKAFQKLGVELPSWASAASQPTNRTKQPEAPAVGGGPPAVSTFNPATDFKPIGKH